MTNLSPLFTWRSAVMSSELSARDRYVALALSLHMNEMGGSCFPSMQSLVKETKLTDRTIQAAIQSLEDAGWLEIDPGGGKKREVAQGIWAASNAYTAIFPQGFKTPERRSPPPRRSFGGSPEGVSDEDVKGERHITKGYDFECPVCGIRFTGVRGLERHLKNVHDEVAV